MIIIPKIIGIILYLLDNLVELIFFKGIVSESFPAGKIPKIELAVLTFTNLESTDRWPLIQKNKMDKENATSFFIMYPPI